MTTVRFIALLLACGGIAQSSPQDDVVIRTTTSLVEVRVVAEDSHGKPVADLKKSDFTISDDREPRTITLFSAYGGLGASSNGGEGQSAESSPTPSEYAVILLDWLNASYGNRVFVRDHVLRLLKSYKPRQRVAVFVLSRDNPRLLYDVTYDRDALTYMVENLSLDFEDKLGPAPPGTPAGGRGGGALSDAAREDAIFRARNQLVETAAAFEKIGDHLLHVPGRKTLLWVSTGIPMTVDGSYYGPFLESAFGKLNRSDTAVYAVYAPGLSMSPNPLIDSLVEFSHRTGGVAYYDNNDLTEEMRQALEDTEVSYTLGFHMPENAKAGLHEIRVQAGRPGIKLRYRESYDPAASIH